MNLVILEQDQFLDENIACANTRQYEHVKRILKLSDGDQVHVGKINGDIGKARLEEHTSNIHFVDITLTVPPPPTLPLTLILALPRPQMIKRILQSIACMGVEHVCFIQSSRVEKSYWQSPTLTESEIKHQLILGLEQGMATQLPKISKHQRFIPFIEDELESIAQDSTRLIAHPGEDASAETHAPGENFCLAVGPEGGFLDKEVERFKARGFSGIHLGRRILKVETAIPVLLAKLYEF